MQDFYRCDEGSQDRAAVVLAKACKKRITDMHYEARIQAIITYYAIYLGQKIKKEDARGMTLTQEEYLKVNIQHQY
jgi:hypothetical protein